MLAPWGTCTWLPALLVLQACAGGVVRAIPSECDAAADLDVSGCGLFKISADGVLLQCVPDPGQCSEKLDFTYKSIRAIHSSAFQNLTGVTEIDLSYNELNDLPEELFRGVSSLQYLTLTENALQEIPNGLFRGLVSLSELLLWGNKLTKLPDGLFAGLSNLDFLDLSYNLLEEISHNHFEGLSALQTIVLNENLLTALPDGLFAGLNNLVFIDLSTNRLTTLPEDIVANFTELDELYWRNNGLTELPAGLLTGLGKLRYLEFANNSLTELPADLLRGLDRLEELDLSDNKLKEVPADLFTGRTSLRRLTLANNRLTGLPDDIFDGLDLARLDVSSNELTNVPIASLAALNQTAFQRFLFAENDFITVSEEEILFLCDADKGLYGGRCADVAYFYYAAANFTQAKLYFEISLDATDWCTVDYGDGIEWNECEAIWVDLTRIIYLDLAGPKQPGDIQKMYDLLQGGPSSQCFSCTQQMVDIFYEIKRNDPNPLDFRDDLNVTTKNNTLAWEKLIFYIKLIETEDVRYYYDYVDFREQKALQQVIRMCFEGRRPGGQEYELGHEYINRTMVLSGETDEFAMYYRAIAHREGLGVVSNLTTYEYWLDRAALFGQPDASVELAWRLERSGSPEDLARALALFKNVTRPRNLDRTIANPTTILNAKLGVTRIEAKESNAPNSANYTAIIAGAAVAAVVLILLLAALIIYLVIRRHKEETAVEIEKRVKKQGFNWITDRQEGFDLICAHRKQQECTSEPLWIDHDSVIKLERLGEGKFGDVFKGVTLVQGYAIVCAIKFLKDADQGAQAEFEAEIRLLSSINHPNIIPVIEAAMEAPPSIGAEHTDTHPHTHTHRPSGFMAMEYMDLGSMDGVLRRQQVHFDDTGQHWTQAEFLWFANEIVKGMLYLSEKSIVHRDLAARNVLVASFSVTDTTPDWRSTHMYDVKLADLGLSRKMADGATYQHSGQKRQLPIRALAPEVFSGREDSSASDVYMFGITIWELYTYGRQPFDHLAVGEMSGMRFISRLRQEKELGFYLERPDDTMSLKVYEILKRCWNPDPELRPTFAKLHHELSELFDTAQSVDIGVGVPSILPVKKAPLMVLSMDATHGRRPSSKPPDDRYVNPKLSSENEPSTEMEATNPGSIPTTTATLTSSLMGLKHSRKKSSVGVYDNSLVFATPIVDADHSAVPSNTLPEELSIHTGYRELIQVERNDSCATHQGITKDVKVEHVEQNNGNTADTARTESLQGKSISTPMTSSCELVPVERRDSCV